MNRNTFPFLTINPCPPVKQRPNKKWKKFLCHKITAPSSPSFPLLHSVRKPFTPYPPAALRWCLQSPAPMWNPLKIHTTISLENPLKFIHVQIANMGSNFPSAMSEAGEIRVEGRVKDGIPYLTKVGSFQVDVSLEGSVILCRQVDQPGMIGAVGSILAEQNVNVSFMTVGRIAPRKHAVMTIEIDEEPNRETLKKIGEVPAIEQFAYLKL